MPSGMFQRVTKKLGFFEATDMKSIYVRLILCFAFVICLTSCAPSALEKNALLYKRIEDYHSAVSWNNAAASGTFAKDPLLRASISRHVKKDLDNARVSEFAADSIEVDKDDENIAHVTASMKYFKAPANIMKTKEVTEKWQFSDKTWYIIETDAF